MSDSTGARPKRAAHRNQPLSRNGLLEQLFTVWFRGIGADLGEPARGRGDALSRRFHIRTFQ